MVEMDAALSGDHNITPPILINSRESKGLESTGDEESDASDFDAPGPSSAPVKSRKKRKLISTPTKPKEPKEEKKKRSSMGSKIEESLARSDEVTSELIEVMKNDVKERRKERKIAARQSKSFLKILAAGVLAKRPGNEDIADKMVQSAVAESSTDSDSD
jgi:hypothetical protein